MASGNLHITLETSVNGIHQRQYENFVQIHVYIKYLSFRVYSVANIILHTG